MPVPWSTLEPVVVIDRWSKEGTDGYEGKEDIGYGGDGDEIRRSAKILYLKKLRS
jgi:hypothetical protein